MSEARPARSDATGDNAHAVPFILALAAAATSLYGLLALSGDLRVQIPLYLVCYVALTAIMLLGWRLVRGQGNALFAALVAALVFRVVASLGEPALSDDVYRYVWDGRVQQHGFHPYRYAPTDAALVELRDEHWSRINHPELKTIYPPVAQLFFRLLVSVKAGPRGFMLTMGLLDFAVVLVLGRLLRRLSLPRDRLILYAWNPLAVLESAGSGHLESLGVLLMLAAGLWIIDRRPVLSTMALVASIHVKLVTAVLFPGHLRRVGPGLIPIALGALLVPFLPFVRGGPLVGGGLFDYAGSWERNATIYAAVHQLLDWGDVGTHLKAGVSALQARIGEWSLPWDFLYHHVWPGEIARLLMGLAMIAWLAYLNLRARIPGPREALLAIGGVLLLSPTLHPWYLLWVLPLAAAYLSVGWLVLGFTVALSYAAGLGEVSWTLRGIEYLPPLAAWLCFRRGRLRRGLRRGQV